MKALVVFWSQTGNTEGMAGGIAEGLKTNHTVDLVNINDAEPNVSEYDIVALGCPAMGAEELEEEIFAPFYEKVKGDLKGKKVVIFGSYGWGDGEWMRLWEADIKETGANLFNGEGFAIQEDEDDIVNRCLEYGKTIK